MSDDKCIHGWTTPPECPQCVADERDALTGKRSELEAAYTAMRELLLTLEHADFIRSTGKQCCPVCGQYKPDHHNNCGLQAALSTTAGRDLLDRLERYENALESISRGDPRGPSGATAREALKKAK